MPDEASAWAYINLEYKVFFASIEMTASLVHHGYISHGKRWSKAWH